MPPPHDHPLLLDVLLVISHYTPLTTHTTLASPMETTHTLVNSWKMEVVNPPKFSCELYPRISMTMISRRAQPVVA